MRKLLYILLAVIALPSCNVASSLIHDGTLVAEVGKHKLYSGEVDMYIPDGLPPEDSSALASQFINSWASNWLYLDAAESELSKQQLNVDKETEEYRNALIKYRYEQAYVESHLDTTVTDDQIDAYFEAHKADFVLKEPVVKARFVRMNAGSPYKRRLSKLIQGSTDDEYGEVSDEDSLAYRSALRYTDYGGKWIPASTLARELGTDYETMFRKAHDGFVEIESEEEGLVLMAQITDIVEEGKTAPVEYEGERIREILLSARRQSLLSGLERDLLENARAEKKFVIHQ